MDKTIAVLGAGSWGTALAMQAARSGGQVLIWARNPEIVTSINTKRKNSAHLGDIILPHNIKATGNITDVLEYKHILIVTPAQSVRRTLEKLRGGKNLSIIIASKGIENESLKLMSEVVSEEIADSRISILSGPNFAREVAEGFPSITNVASYDNAVLNDIVRIFGNKNFTVSPIDDVIGVQICGAVKNVVAIACGVCLGSNLGENARAAVLTKGLTEMGKLVVTLGGKYETLMSPAGVGDLTLTCSSKTSRNMVYGINMATGKAQGNSLSEGSHTAKAISALAKKHEPTLPLITAVANAVETPAKAMDLILKAIT